METKRQYTAPGLTVVIFKVERGYANSNPLQTLRIVAEVFNPGLNSIQESWTAEEDLFRETGWDY